MWIFLLYSFSFSIILRSFSILLITLLVRLSSSFILSHYPSFYYSSVVNRISSILDLSLIHLIQFLELSINPNDSILVPLIPTISNHVKNTIWLFGIQRDNSSIMRNKSTMEERLISPILFIHRNQ